MSNVNFYFFINLTKKYHQLQWLLSTLLQRIWKGKKGERKRPFSGDQLSYCVDNRLENLMVSKTPSIHSFQILVTNFRNIWTASLDFLITFSIEMMQIRDNFPEIRWNYSENNHTDLVPNKTQGNVIKLQTNIAAFTQMKNMGKVTGQAVKENKNLFLGGNRARYVSF